MGTTVTRARGKWQTHMFLSVEGFVMPTAPKPKKGQHHEYIKRLPDDVYDAIQELLPEPLTDEYM